MGAVTATLSRRKLAPAASDILSLFTRRASVFAAHVAPSCSSRRSTTLRTRKASSRTTVWFGSLTARTLIHAY